MKKIIKEANGYGVVQKAFMKLPISVHSKSVYALLKTYSGSSDACYPSLNTISKDLMLSKNTVLKAIKELEDIKMVSVFRSQKPNSKEKTVNTYIPLSVMVEIDPSKPYLESIMMDLGGSSGELGGSSPEPRGSRGELGVVHDVNCKNNNIKNNIEDNLNIINEQSSLFEFDNSKSDNVGQESNDKKEQTLYQKMVEYWLKVFHPDWSFGATDGKKIKSLIKKLQKSLSATKQDYTDQDVLDLFKAFCTKLPEFYKSQTLSVLDSKYDSIVDEIKKGNGKSINTSNQHQRATAFNTIMSAIPDVRK